MLSVLRSDPRYASPLRFEAELLPGPGGLAAGGPRSRSREAPYHGGDRSGARDVGAAAVGSQHPLLLSLRDLHDLLCHLAGGGGATAAGATEGDGPPPPPNLDALSFVGPFAAAVSSREISAPVTGAALSALHKFLLYGFLDPSSPGAAEAATVVARCVRHCAFEETSGDYGYAPNPSSGGELAGGTAPRRRLPASDEQVVLKLLSLSSLLVRCPAGVAHLAPSDVMGVFDTCLHVAGGGAAGASELLRSAAEDALGDIVLSVFGRYDCGGGGSDSSDVGVEDDGDDDGEETMPEAGDESRNAGSLSTAGVATMPTVASSELDAASVGSQQDNREGGGVGGKNLSSRAEGKQNLPASATSSSAAPAVLGRLVDLTDLTRNPAPTCVLSLSLINIALETSPDASISDDINDGGGSAAPFACDPDLVSLVRNDLCRHLLQLSTTSDLVVLSLTLRVIFNLFVLMKDSLKVQLEVFLTSVHLRILDQPTANKGTGDSAGGGRATLEQREVALEGLLEFCREPALMQDIWLNFDCDFQVRLDPFPLFPVLSFLLF